nr:PAAR domain-containing protein [uncultured Caldimonas sp.]
MPRSLIVLGDRTSHGGAVITADTTSDISGKYMARVGDLTVCRKCKGIFPIKAGPSDLVDGAGKGYARHGDKTACGASLVASQMWSTWSDVSSGGHSAVADDTASLSLATAYAVEAPSICLECLAGAAKSGSTLVVRG